MKLSVHPLFFGVVVYCAFFGGLPVALIYLLTAILHECGHIFCAARLGFSCQRIKLMPYGAAAVCDLEGVRAWDEVKLALAGPAVNAFICVALAGLWWFYPAAYAYTDTVMTANLTMLAVNLLPAYPLDGGRVARRAVAALFSERAADIALRAAGLAVALASVIIFFVCGFNITFLFFGAFLACSAFEKPAVMQKINFSSAGRLKRGMEVRYILTDGSLTYKDAVKMLDASRYSVFQLYDGGVADEITQDELYEAMTVNGLYDKVFK